MKLNPKRSLIIISVVSLLVGGVAVWLSADYIERRVTGIRADLEAEYELVPLVAARGNIEKGEQISRRNVRLKQVPRRFIPTGAVPPQQVRQIEGASVVVDIPDDQPILANYVTRGPVRAGTFSGQIGDGMRAVTFPVDIVSSVGGLLNPGDRIDLLASMRMQNRDGLVTLPLLDNLEILAVGEVFRGASDRRYQHITLELSPTNAARLLQARQEGSLTAVLRAPGDDEPGFANAMTVESLFEEPFGEFFERPTPPAREMPMQPMPPRQPVVVPPRNIEVIVGGRG
jgi:pilus assembly protein CpaB